jgi:hypothetical protein
MTRIQVVLVGMIHVQMSKAIDSVTVKDLLGIENIYFLRSQ